MGISKKIKKGILIGFCILAVIFLLPVIRQTKAVSAEAATESDKFFYNGKNASEYKGESIFVFTEEAGAGITDSTQSFEIGFDLYTIMTKLNNVKTIVVDDSTSELYLSMLKRFQAATTLHIGKNLKTIHAEGEEYFENSYMKALCTIEVDKENSCFVAEDNVLYSTNKKTLVLYPAGKKDTYFSIPDTVVNFLGTNMGKNEFLLKLNFGKSFGVLDTPYLKSGDMIPSVTSGLSSLQEITVDADNSYLSAVNGVLYNKEQTETIAWPNELVMEKVVFPDTLQSIALGMISNADQVKSIALSPDMEELWVVDFTSRLNSFTNLQEVSVPAENKNFTVWKGGLYNKEKTIFYGFPQKSPLTTLEFPKGITGIELRNSVYPNIEKVIFPSTFTEFYTHEGGGFTGFFEIFPNLKNIQISAECKNYKSVDGVVYNKKGSELIVYPNQKEGTSYTIPDSVSNMEWSIFSGCTKLKTLTIGKNLQANQNWYMLMEHSSISEFKTVKNCKNYKAVDGILYNRKVTMLEAYPPNKKAATYKVPDSVTDISDLAYARKLEKLVLGKKVKYAGEFTDMKKLESISVNKDNPYYKTIDGILYNKNGTEEIYNPNK